MLRLKFSLATSYRIAFALIIGFQVIPLAYAPLYFTSLGYSPFEVSLISGMENVAGILGPALLVARAYPFGLGVSILSGVSGLLMGCVSPLFGASILLSGWAFSLFLNRGVFALINEGAQVHDRDGQLSYSETRSWGSGSFLAAMYGIGLVVESYGIHWSMICGIVMLLLLSAVGLNIRDHDKEINPKTVLTFIKESFSSWHFIFYTTLVFIWASHGPAYTYMSLHLVNLGWTPGQIALSWNIAVVTEILIFLVFSRIQKYFSLEFLLTLTQFACIIRWIILWLSSDPVLINLSQVLHGLTFGLCFVVSQKLLLNSVTEQYRKPAFALYFAASLGAGSLLGKLAAGWSTRDADFTGDFHNTFLQGVYLAIISLVVWWFRRFSKLPNINPSKNL